ncbi:MAG: MBL fold metallo-hydrolase [Bdellovibrionales bacterium RIFOXYD1_FULL_44_7]|nr:MAG: MBL fold metallo-hydrolase [Bdellovibrionales bacterium RIFOXYD1_FULL_44_7]
MLVKLWGVRGSIPAPIAPVQVENKVRNALTGFFEAGYKKKSDIEEFVKNLPLHLKSTFGGNTLCVEVNSSETQVIIDAGSGLRQLGYKMLQGPCGKGKGEVHIILTHLHWDHLVGIPFFVPIFIPGNTIHFYAVQPELRDMIKVLFKKPFFPVESDKLGAKIEYHQIQPRTSFSINDVAITAYELDHPDPCFGYRLENNGKALAHCVDTECTRVNREQLGADLALYKNADLMIFDAQYTLMETIEKVTWGHASALIGIDLALREGIKRVVFVHHDPGSDDEKVTAAAMQADRYFKNQLKQAKRSNHSALALEWSFGHEGMEIEL